MPSLLLLAILVGFPAPASVAKISVERLAGYADAIVIGRVVRIVCVSSDGVHANASEVGKRSEYCSEGRCVAEVEVERVLSGPPKMRRLWYLAEGTWTCSTVTAVLGERTLFFFAQYPVFVDDEPQLRAVAAELTGGFPVLSDAWSGRGRMPIKEIEGSPSVVARKDVLPPDGLAIETADGGTDSYSVTWSARLSDVIGLIERMLAKVDVRVPVHAVSGLPAFAYAVADDDDLLCAIWRDGSAVWATDRSVGGRPYLAGQVTGPDALYLSRALRGLKLKTRPESSPGPGAILRTRVVIREAFEPVSAGSPARPDALDESGATAQLLGLLLSRLPEDGESIDPTSVRFRSD